MNYVSTRGKKNLGQFCDVLLTGLAPDGGLAMPEMIPQIDKTTLEMWKEYRYQDLAYAVMSPFICDIPEADLRAIIEKSYTVEKFHHPDIAPLTQLGDSDLYLLELSNGPSLAFKDMAMQFLGQAFEYVLEKRGKKLNILGATSGDTGSAAEYAMLGKRNVNVFMLSPYGRMSAFQQAQMFSLNEPNIYNISVKGVFDDCQDLVKAVNADAAFKAAYHIGAVNSINLARVLAQAVYYFKAYFASGVRIGEPVDVCVPSGNFGNIFAGYLAKAMGLPLRQLVVASNENDVLYEFFTSGQYRVRPSHDVAKTSSPSMDIGKASNFERFMYMVSGNDGEQIKTWWQQIDAQEIPSIGQSHAWQQVQKSGFKAGRSTHANRLQTIADIDKKYQRLIDPHTADGVFVAQQFVEAGVPMICLETALPTKFEETVMAAGNRRPQRPERFHDIEQKPRQCEVMENDVDVLKAYIRQSQSFTKKTN